MESASIAIDRSPFVLGLHVPGLRGRYRTGIERHPDSPANLCVGRFSLGVEQQSELPVNLRVGCFSAGIAQHPPTASRLRHGSFELIARR